MPLGKILSGNVEIDEAYIGGKPRPGSDEINKRGRGTKKVPVVARSLNAAVKSARG